MPRYMLLMYRPVDGGPSNEDMAEQHARWTRFHQDLTDAGLLVDNNGLGQPSSATTVRVRDGAPVSTRRSTRPQTRA